MEYLPNYYPDGKSCTFRVYTKILEQLEKKNGVQYFGKNWEIIRPYILKDAIIATRLSSIKTDVYTERRCIFFMNTLQWLEETKYTVLKLQPGLFSDFAHIEYS